MDEALKRRLDELALRAFHTRRTCFTRFLEPSFNNVASLAAARAGARVAFWGGYEGAERCIAAFYSPDEEAPGPDDFPITALRIEWNAKFGHPGHRDLLGAVMGLGIDRETTGDIAMAVYDGAECAYLFAVREMADYIAANLEGAGRTSVKVSIAREALRLCLSEGEPLRLTVQNERLDAVLAAACRLSRSEAQRMIAAGLVKLNHVPNLRPDARLSEGDLISARGLGRVKVVAFEGQSRRGRQIVRVLRYGK